MAYLEIKNLRKSFGDNEVLKGIDLTLEKGQVLAIIGASGGPLIAGAVIGATGGMNYNYIWVTAIFEIVGAILVYIFYPKSGGKYGDPQALKEAAETLGGDAVRGAVSSTKIGLDEL